MVIQTSPQQRVQGHSSGFINNLWRGGTETLLPSTLSGFCIALCSSHLASRALTLPLIDISVIYGPALPWPSSNWRWPCDLSLSDAAGRVLFLCVRYCVGIFSVDPAGFCFNERVHLLRSPRLTFISIEGGAVYRNNWRKSMDRG